MPTTLQINFMKYLQYMYLFSKKMEKYPKTWYFLDLEG